MRTYKRYKGVKHPKLLSRDRKTKHITQEEVEMILAVRKEHPVCAISLEKILDRKEIHIPHNCIHKVLLQHGFAMPEPKKQNRRKLCLAAGFNLSSCSSISTISAFEARMSITRQTDDLIPTPVH